MIRHSPWLLIGTRDKMLHLLPRSACTCTPTSPSAGTVGRYPSGCPACRTLWPVRLSNHGLLKGKIVEAIVWTARLRACAREASALNIAAVWISGRCRDHVLGLGTCNQSQPATWRHVKCHRRTKP